MILVIHGPETYLVHRKLRQAFDKARAAGTVGVTELDAGDTDLKKAGDALRGGSLFDEKAVVVFRNWFMEKPADDSNKLAELLEAAPKETVVIVAESGEVDKRRKSFAKLAKQADKSWHFPTFDEPAAAAWLVKRAEEAGSKLSPALARNIVSALGTDGWMLATEIDKLVAASDGEVTESLVANLTGSNRVSTIWELVDAVAAKDFRKAQTALRSLLQSGEPPQRIFAMVVRQYRILLGVQAAEGQPDAAVAKQLGVHPYSVKQARRQISRFSPDELRRIYDELAELDVAGKSGKRDPEQALELFVAERTVA
ncbi:MAG: DNA polymerase III subunit delta [bacterium]|nr:DNA polymerase III subunit delta [bacterium]MDZ4248444.1 DNA polymerase III subunit delta [Patescibacteria group bacterium]